MSSANFNFLMRHVYRSNQIMCTTLLIHLTLYYLFIFFSLPAHFCEKNPVIPITSHFPKCGSEPSALVLFTSVEHTLNTFSLECHLPVFCNNLKSVFKITLDVKPYSTLRLLVVCMYVCMCDLRSCRTKALYFA